jgi:hypothetical protein
MLYNDSMVSFLPVGHADLITSLCYSFICIPSIRAALLVRQNWSAIQGAGSAWHMLLLPLKMKLSMLSTWCLICVRIKKLYLRTYIIWCTTAYNGLSFYPSWPFSQQYKTMYIHIQLESDHIARYVASIAYWSKSAPPWWARFAL